MTLITYEDFGAIGDGITDDLPAICAAHEAANKQGLAVRARPDACYHLGQRALCAKIATDTDWNTARFTIDDRNVEDHTQGLFLVVSLQDQIDIDIKSVFRDQKSLDVHPQTACFVQVENDAHRVYIRRGANQNDGEAQHDSFILHPDGSIEGAIDWNYPRISKLRVKPIDEETLTVRGGVFTTIANNMQQPEGYNYWSRGIDIARSNTVMEGITHYVTGEGVYGQPYRGFLSASLCANVCYRDCFVTAHKIYQTIGAAGVPVSMGSYDLHANCIVNFTMQNCRMNHITDRTRWGIIGTNFCKNILLEDCELSRMDTHMGVAGGYTFRRCTFGWMGLNAIGRGPLQLEDCTLNGNHLISFRGDYGSTWEGDVHIKNCRWIPNCGDECAPVMFATHNDGTHDFGYPCFMPQHIHIDGLHVEDSNTANDYAGLYLFRDPDDGVETNERPFPYTRSQSVQARGLTCASGKAVRISPNEAVNELIEVDIQ